MIYMMFIYIKKIIFIYLVYNMNESKRQLIWNYYILKTQNTDWNKVEVQKPKLFPLKLKI